MPLSSHKISFDFGKESKNESFKSSLNYESGKRQIIEFENYNTIKVRKQIDYKELFYNNIWILYSLYIIFTIGLLIRLLIGLFGIIRLFIISDRQKTGKYILITHKQSMPFSFFNFIFVPEKHKEISISDNLFLHERTHSDQMHSIDILLFELFNCIFWFNPLIWHCKSRIKLIHEYLADEAVLQIGVDKVEYHKDLLSQFEDFHHLYLGSNYFYSIKKRIIMMNQIKVKKIGALNYLSLILLFCTLFLFVGFINWQQKPKQESDSLKTNFPAIISEGDYLDTQIQPENKLNDQKQISKETAKKSKKANQISKKPVITAMELPKMNVLFIGLDNPLKIAVSGIDNSELQVAIDNGQISGENGEYNIMVSKPGISIVTVSYKGEVIQKTEFRVKRIPDPLITENKYYSGKISKEEMLRWGTMEILYKYFNLAMNTNIIFYRMIAIRENRDPIEFYGGNKVFTDLQLDVIKTLKSGDKLYFEDIIVLNEEDYSSRKVGAVTITIE